MESSSLNTLTTVKLKSLHSREIDYAELFCGRKIIIFSIPVVANENSWHQLKNYQEHYKNFRDLGVDTVCCISSSAWVIPFVSTHSTTIVPLHDVTNSFLSSVRDYTQSTKDINTLADRWQYVAVVNDGHIEKLFSNPVKESMSMKIYFDKRYQYRGLDAKTVIDYLEQG